MIIFSDSTDPIFNSRDPNQVPKTTLTNLLTVITLVIGFPWSLKLFLIVHVLTPLSGDLKVN